MKQENAGIKFYSVLNFFSLLFDALIKVSITNSYLLLLMNKLVVFYCFELIQTAFKTAT